MFKLLSFFIGSSHAESYSTRNPGRNLAQDIDTFSYSFYPDDQEPFFFAYEPLFRRAIFSDSMFFGSDWPLRLYQKCGDLIFFFPELFIIAWVLWTICSYVFHLHIGKSTRSLQYLIESTCCVFIICIIFYLGLSVFQYELIDNIFWQDYFQSYFYSSQLNITQPLFALKIGILFFGLIFFLISHSVVKYYSFISIEHVLLIVLSIWGSLLLVAANDFLVFYLALEVSTIPLYILVSSKFRCNFSTEAGLKYFIMGSFSSGLILFGLSYLYGFTGVTSFSGLSLYFSHVDLMDAPNLYFLLLGMFLFLFGLFIKIGIAPFHFWVIDVYGGAPMLITLFMMTVPKVALWWVLYYLMLDVFNIFFASYLLPLLAMCIIFSFFFGIFPGVYQVKLKRLLIYSSIASNGFFLLAFYSAVDISALICYLFIYLVTSFGFFAFYFLLRKQSSLKLITKISELNNFYQNNPYLAYCGSILLFSMAGIPPFAGFLGKFFLYTEVFLSAPILIFISLLFGCISTFYYIRISKWMFFSNNLLPSAKNTWIFFKKPDLTLVVILSLSVFFNIMLIFYFDSFMHILDFLLYL